MRIQPNKRRVLVTVLEAAKLDFPHCSDCGHRACFPLQLGFWSYEGRCRNLHLCCSCSTCETWQQCLSRTFCMPTGSQQGHLPIGILDTVAWTCNPLRRLGKHSAFFLALRGKQAPFNTTNASFVITSAITGYSFSYLCLCFYGRRVKESKRT